MELRGGSVDAVWRLSAVAFRRRGGNVKASWRRHGGGVDAAWSGVEAA